MTLVEDQKFIVIATKPRYSNKKDIPVGEQNFAVLSYSLFNGDEMDYEKRKVSLGLYKTGFNQVNFPLNKVQVVVPKDDQAKFKDESDFKGRFFLTLVEEHLKVIDVVT